MQDLEQRRRRKVQSRAVGKAVPAARRPGTADSLVSVASQPFFSGEALHMAAMEGRLADLEQALSVSRALVNRVDSSGRSPLFYGVRGNQAAAVKLLLSYGAKVNLAAADGSTALHEAAHRCPKDMVQLLLGRGADPRLRDHAGRTPLHWATDNVLGECLGLLARHEHGNPNAVDADDMTPIMYAAYHQRVHHVRMLLNLRADLEEKDCKGNTAMHWAVHPDSTTVLKVLLTVNATFFRNAAGQTVMHLVGKNGCAEAVDLVAKLRADSVHDVDRAGRTPLFLAAAYNNRPVLLRLLARGADPSWTDADNETPLSVAEAEGSQDCLEALQIHLAIPPAGNLSTTQGRALRPMLARPAELENEVPPDGWNGPTSPHRLVKPSRPKK